MVIQVKQFDNYPLSQISIQQEGEKDNQAMKVAVPLLTYFYRDRSHQRKQQQCLFV